MELRLKKILVMALLLIANFVNSQVDNSSLGLSNINPKNPDIINDIKILNTNYKLLEFEYTPFYLTELDFLNSARNTSEFGKPDLPFRSIPVFLPSLNGNRLEILDIKYEDSNPYDVQPIPTPRKNENGNIYPEYKKNDSIYFTSKFYPDRYSELVNFGILRDKYIANIQINPILYNPSSQTIRKIKYIRLRIYFGDIPLTSNKPLSTEELNLISGLAINSVTASNWISKEFYYKDKISQNSVLANGDIYKIEIKETGIYKLDKNFFLQSGINISSIDPRTIKIYNNGGEELPFDNNIPIPIDLTENRIFVEGEADGRFDENDYVLFLGLSPHYWKYDIQNQKYSHSLNHYTNSNYYFLTFGGSQGLRMNTINSPNIPNLPPATFFKERFYEEPEVNNLGSTGTLWLSQRIGAGEPGFIFNKELQGYLDGSIIRLKFRYGNGSYNSVANFLLKDDNSTFSTIVPVDRVYGEFSHINLTETEAFYSLNPSQSSIKLSLSLPLQYNNNTVSGYYDYYEITYNRKFTSVSNNFLRFNSFDTVGTVEYQVSNFSSQDTRIFDITSFFDVKIITPLSFNSGILRFQDTYFPNNLKEYIIAGGSGFKSPTSVVKIQNQNLHGITEGASFIILSPTEFITASNRLKSLRESPGQGNPNYLKTLVVDINQVYNEFGCGQPDPVSVRNFLKYAFNNWNIRPVYVLFMGDGHYDYKNIYNLSVKNFLPPIEKTTDDISELWSYPSDDFTCEINESYPSPQLGIRTDFASGRLCVNSLAEANYVVDKIYEYENPSNFGIWKKKIMYVADDGWTTQWNQGQEGNIHTQQCEEVAEYYTPSDFEKEKIYIVTYPAVITPQGRRKPGANIDIIKGWNEGRLAINYTGHGSTDLWAHEHIFVRNESIPQLTNKGRYPFVTIASCDLARFDDPYLISAGEQLVNTQNAGAIGVVAANRPVYSNFNATFNNFLWGNFTKLKDTLNLPIRAGKSIFIIKQFQLQTVNDNDLKFLLVGDPTLRIGIPEYFTKIDSINSTPGSDTAKIKALQKILITGSILKPDSTVWNNYNGELTLKILDVDKNITFYDFGQPFYFRLDGGTIFKGNTQINDGKWKIEFVVPKDISYNTGNGRLIAYFRNQNTEGSGFSNNFIFSGLDSSAVQDTTGPIITVFMDNRNFRSGDLINQNTKIIADFFDDNGINLTGAIGHKIEAIFNNDENNKIDLTSYYNSTTNYQNGTLEYNIDNLADGKYNLKLRAWDTYNNFSETSINFTVAGNSVLTVSKIFNYPNPMKEYTNFTFQHNFDIPLTSEIYIYTVSGRLIKKLTRTNITDKFVTLEWDGKDEDGDNIANGTYLYRIVVKTEDGKNTYTDIGKLAKLK